VRGQLSPGLADADVRGVFRRRTDLSHLSDRVLLAKSKLSELLRGVGLYPRWEVIYRRSIELNMPIWRL